MGGDDADDISGATADRQREQRLEAFLLELRDVLHTRVGERVVADERRLAPLRRVPRESLATIEPHLADLALVGRRGGAEREPTAVAVQEIDEAGVHAARVRYEANDGAQHLGEVER